MDLVVTLYHIQALGVEGHQMPLPIFWGLLQENCPGGKVGAVSFYLKGRVVIQEEEDGSRDNQAEILDLGLLKLALFQFEVELVLAEVFQDEAHDLAGFLQGFGVDEDVIKVYTHYAFGNKVSEDVVHHCLEGGWAIEGGLPLISLLDAYIVVAPPDIQFSEVLHIPEVVDELRDEGERVAVLHSHDIENP
ncbi:hypothetical protein C0989_001817, partial [Termitomyces sp. Mn162]